MNFQEKLFESSAALRSRAEAFAASALQAAKSQADVAGKRVEKLKASIGVLNIAGRELNQVARRHAIRFVKQNSSLAADVRNDVSALARTTFATLTAKAPARKRKTAPRKRVSKAA